MTRKNELRMRSCFQKLLSALMLEEEREDNWARVFVLDARDDDRDTRTFSTTDTLTLQ